MLPFAVGENYTTGGWQSVQYIAFSRYLPVFSVIVQSVATNKNFSDDNDKMTELSAFRLLCSTLHSLVSRLLTQRFVSTEEIDVHIKLFLSSIHSFDVLVNGSNSERVLSDAANFLSLLNLPEQIRKFGPLHWFPINPPPPICNNQPNK